MAPIAAIAGNERATLEYDKERREQKRKQKELAKRAAAAEKARIQEWQRELTQGMCLCRQVLESAVI